MINQEIPPSDPPAPVRGGEAGKATTASAPETTKTLAPYGLEPPAPVVRERGGGGAQRDALPDHCAEGGWAHGYDDVRWVVSSAGRRAKARRARELSRARENARSA